VYRTLDGGTNWTDITRDLTNVGTLRCMRFVERPSGKALVLGADSGVYLLDRPLQPAGVLSWAEVGSGLPNALAMDLAYEAEEGLLIVSLMGRGSWMTPLGSTLLVVDTNNAGPGSLRQTLVEANATSDVVETITFRIPGDGPHTISPLTALPTIANSVAIDGWSQTGVAGTHDIEIDGSQCSDPDGLVLATSNCIVRGLVINRFSDRGIDINGAAATNNWIYGNRIGTDVAGTTTLGNGRGIHLRNNAAFNLIGTDGDGSSDLLEANILSGNANEGVRLGETANNVIAGNWIGTDSTGLIPVPNTEGVTMIGGAFKNIIGSDRDGVQDSIEGNLITHNTSHGLRIRDGGSISNQIVGNVISDNGGDGVALQSNAGSSHSIQQNRIFDNGGLGIDLGNNGVTSNDVGDVDGGPNDTQNYPDLSPANYANVLVGSLSSDSNTTYRVELFANTTCDASGYGEGETYLGFTNVTTDASGTANFVFAFMPVPDQTNFTATATDPNGNTSEFSPCVVGGLPNLPPLLTDLEVLGNGAFQFGFTNSVGAKFVVLASPSISIPLTNWLAIGPAVEIAPGEYRFVDPGVTNASRRFYILRTP
jgi:hypothetical protein